MKKISELKEKLFKELHERNINKARAVYREMHAIYNDIETPSHDERIRLQNEIVRLYHMIESAPKEKERKEPSLMELAGVKFEEEIKPGPTIEEIKEIEEEEVEPEEYIRKKYKITGEEKVK